MDANITNYSLMFNNSNMISTVPYNQDLVILLLLIIAFDLTVLVSGIFIYLFIFKKWGLKG